MDWKRQNFLLVYYLSALTPTTYPTNFTDSNLLALSDSSAIHYTKHEQTKQVQPPNSTSNFIKTLPKEKPADVAVFRISNHANVSHFKKQSKGRQQKAKRKVQKPLDLLTIISSFFITRPVPEKKATTPDFSTPSFYYYYDKSEQEYTYLDDYIDDDFDSISQITEINGTKRENATKRMTEGQRMIYDLSYILGFMFTVVGIICIAVQKMFKEEQNGGGGFVGAKSKGQESKTGKRWRNFLILDTGRVLRKPELNPKQVGQVGNLFGGRNDNDDDLIYV